MRKTIFLSLFIIIIIIDAEHQVSSTFHKRDINNAVEFQPDVPIPFPECFTTESAPSFLNPRVIEHLFDMKLKEEEKKLKQERNRNINLNNDEIIDFDEIQLRSDTHNGALLSRTATKVADELLFQLSCITNATVTHQLKTILRKIRLPSNFCVFRENPNCNGLTNYRTITGVCNNLRRPYQGSSQTAFGRLLPAVYDDGLSKPRSRSVLGGLLPPCRQISLSMGSKPNFDNTINNLWVTYGQFLVHDLTLSRPVTDSGRTPITSCSCNSKDTDMCTIIDIAANDPFMSGQKCMAIPATAQAFSDQICALGIKEQMNGNSHYIDLSVTYGSTRGTAANIRTGFGGFMKTIQQTGFKFDLPPGQRDGRSCIDSTETHKCFAGGDSRMIETSVLASVQTQWLRMHNIFARELANIRPDWRANDNILYEESKKILSAIHQHYTYEEWLPILIGKQATEQYISDNSLFSRYNPTMPGVVFNEAVTAVLRLHTFVRDLVSRCRPNGQLIDQLWLNDISSRCRFAYDAKTNGLDSFLCGALSDYSFAGDSNYAQQIHHRLFESTNQQGDIRRNDIVAINICRGREHGIPGYNAYREFCGLQRVNHFQDFSNTMSVEAIQKMQIIYKHPEDVDLFVGVNHEKHLPGAVVGPVSACIIGIQFQHLKYGDRLFYTHQGEFTLDQLNSIKKYSYNCFICHSTDIEKVARNPFRPPDDLTNPLIPCNQCPIFDFSPWRISVRI